MPIAEDDDVAIRYETAGSGEETVVFLAEAAVGPWLWSWQAPALAGPYRTLVVATRGTDGSADAGPNDVEELAADLEAVLANAGVDRAHLVGAGLGGATALQYAHQFGRARSLTLVGVPPDGDRIDDAALAQCLPATDDAFEAALPLGFSDDYLADGERRERLLAWRRAEDATGTVRDAHLSAFRSFSPPPLYECSLPTLVCHGEDDPVVPLAAGRDLATDLPRAQFEPVAGRRFCFVEHSRAVSDAIGEFLTETTDD